MKLVYMKWLDAMSDDNTWQDLEDLKKQELRPVEVVGWILSEDKDKVILISSYDAESKTGGGGVVVPRLNIIHLQLLNKGIEIPFKQGEHSN
tara:strand:- start:111 stop:386 length:276 start_codon:yes stop_codon:yes gene_type:complete